MSTKSLCSLMFFCFMSLSMFSQTNKAAIQPINFPENVKTALTIKEEMMIKEVFKDKFEKYILNSPSRLRNMKHLLRNRMSIKRFDKPLNIDKYTNLYNVSLFNVYNESLKKDENYNQNNFNPLKYDLDFFKIGSSIYKIFDSPYYIIIKSQTIKK